MVFKVSVLIDRPVEVVVAALMDPENHPYWQTGLRKFEVVKREPGEVGSIAHLHYSEKGRPYVLEDRMIVYEPGKRIVSQVTGEAIAAEVETLLRPSGDGTEMTIRWSGQGKILVLRILLPFLRGKMVRQSRAELGKFKQLVETRGIRFSGLPEIDVEKETS
jgi:carbon monoxide dehydrogenase subunit G